MKRFSIKKTGIIFIIGVSLAWAAFISKEQDHPVSELAFSNIEALAAGESGGSDCQGSGSLYCNGGYYKYRFTR